MDSEKKQIEDNIDEHMIIKKNILKFLRTILYFDFKNLNKNYSILISLLFTVIVTIMTGLFNIITYMYNKGIFDFYGINSDLYLQNTSFPFTNFFYNALSVVLLLIDVFIITFFKSSKKKITSKLLNFIFTLFALFPTTTILVYQFKNSLTGYIPLYILFYCGAFLLYHFTKFINKIGDYIDEKVSIQDKKKDIPLKVRVKKTIVILSIILVACLACFIRIGKERCKRKNDYYIIDSNKAVVYTLSDKYIVLDAKIDGETITIKKNTSTVINIEDKTTTFKKFKKAIIKDN